MGSTGRGAAPRKAAVRRKLMVIFALAVLARADGLLAEGTPGTPLLERSAPAAPADLFPATIEAYASRSEVWALTAADPGPAGHSLRAIETPASGFSDEGATNSSSRRRYLPVVLSLLVPGTGEIAMGYYWRGAALVAAEITAWTGWVHYHDKGLDSRAEYERFADAHWNTDRWIERHAIWQDPVYQGEDPTYDNLELYGPEWEGWPPYHTWHSKEEEKQNYYENIGKYDWFISGWDDWNLEGNYDPATIPRETDNRTTYRSMRKKSNDELDKATGFIYLSVAARVISLVETLILTRQHADDAPAGDASSGFSVRTRATGLASGEVALVYSFR